MNRDDSGATKRQPILIDAHTIRDPGFRGRANRLFGPGEVKEAGIASGENHVTHGLEGRTDEEPKRPALGLHENMNGDISRNLVGGDNVVPQAPSGPAGYDQRAHQ